MPSNAFSGVGTVFSRESDTSSGTYDPIAEINNLDGPNKTRDVIDVTSLDSDGGYREFIGGFRDGGEVTLSMNFTLDSYDDLNADFESEDKHSYRIVLNDTGNTTFTFDALVTNLGMAVPLDDKVTSSVTLKISGQVALES